MSELNESKNKMSQRKLKTLSLEQRVEVLRLLNQNETQTSIANIFGVGQAVISRIKKNAESILSAWKSNKNPNRKRKRNSTAEDLDNALVLWFNNARSGQLTVNGPILKEKAKQIGEELGLSDFKVSNGWLERWKIRNNIKFKVHHEGKQVSDIFGIVNGIPEYFEQYVAIDNDENIVNTLQCDVPVNNQNDAKDSTNVVESVSNLLLSEISIGIEKDAKDFSDVVQNEASVENESNIKDSSDVAIKDSETIQNLLLNKVSIKIEKYAEDSSSIVNDYGKNVTNSLLNKIFVENENSFENSSVAVIPPTLVATLQAMNTVHEYLKASGCSSYDSFYKLKNEILHLSKNSSV